MSAVVQVPQGQPGSVILTKWRAEREAQRARRPADTQQGARAYAGAAVNRLTSDWSALNTSADSELLTSLRILRARSRELVRDNEHAKSAVRIIKHNVIGTGVGLQAQISNARGKLIDKANSLVEAEWTKWTQPDSFHVAGKLGLPEMLRLIMGEWTTAGEGVIRKVRRPFGQSTVPLALEFIEADRLMDQWQSARAPNGNTIRMGVEVDEWLRPVAYWFHPTHPGDYQFAAFVPSKFLRVPAEDIIHVHLVDRWPQTRGEPWFHSSLRTTRDMHGYSDAEIVRARASANVVGVIMSPDPVAPDDTVDNGHQVMDMEPGIFKRLLPGESFDGFNPSSPNPSIEPFMRFMLRKIASGIGVSYESLSRDYSQSNYSSSRLALLDDRDHYRVLQGWIVRNVLANIYVEWMDAAVLAGVLPFADYYTNRDKYLACRWKPRGWSWIDPTREVQAFRMAVRAGFVTVSDVIAQTANGQDAEDVFKARRQELDAMADLDLVFDSDPAQVDDKGKGQAIAPGQEANDGPAKPGEAAGVDASGGAPESDADDADDAGSQ